MEEYQTNNDYNKETEIDVNRVEHLRQLSDGVFADYSSVPKKKLSTFRATLKTYSLQMLLSLCKGSVTDPLLENCHTYTTDSNEIFGMEAGACWYYTARGFKYDDVDTYIKNNKGMSFFDEKKDFSFASSQEVKNNIKTILENLGIKDSNYYIYPISETMFDEISAFYNETFGPFEDGKDASYAFGGYKEYYYVHVCPTVEGIEVYDQETGYIEKGTITFGTDINIVYTENGVEALFIGNAYDIETIDAKDIVIISQEDAEKKLVEKYKNLVTYQPTVFTDLKLIYLPIPSNFSEVEGGAEYYILTPAWCFIDEKGNRILFNAINGKEIL